MGKASPEAVARSYMVQAVKVLRTSALDREYTLPFNEALVKAEECLFWLEEDRFHKRTMLGNGHLTKIASE